MNKMIYGYLDPGLSVPVSDQQKAINIFLKEKQLKADKWLNESYPHKTTLTQTTLFTCNNLLKTGDTLVFYTYPIKKENVVVFFEELEKLIKKEVKIYSVYDVFSSQTNQKIQEISSIGKIIGRIEKQLLHFQKKK